MPKETIIVIVVVAVVVVLFIAYFVFWLSRYKRCPADKIMVIYGKVGKDRNGNTISAKCIHGGAAFIVPVLQNYAFLDLAPMRLEISVKESDIRVTGTFTVAISTEKGVMQNAAERLLHLKQSEIEIIARDIVTGVLRTIMQDTTADESRDKFLEKVAVEAEHNLAKTGIRIININITEYIKY